MAFCGRAYHLQPGRCRRVELTEQAVTFPEQEIADVQRHRLPVGFVERLFAVAHRVAVLDVIVDQRRLVETFDSNRCAANGVRKWTFGIASKRHVRTGCEKRPPSLSGLRQPVTRDLRRLSRDRPHEARQRLRAEPRLHFAADTVEVHSIGPVVTGQMNDIPDPIDVDSRVDAVILQERDGDPRNRGRLHVWKCLLEHRQTTHADDRVNLSSLNDRCDDG